MKITIERVDLGHGLFKLEMRSIVNGLELGLDTPAYMLRDSHDRLQEEHTVRRMWTSFVATIAKTSSPKTPPADE